MKKSIMLNYRRLNTAFTICMCIFLTGLSQSQDLWQTIIAEETPEDLQVTSDLYQLSKLAIMDRNASRQRASSVCYQNREDNRIYVEFMSLKSDSTIDLQPLRESGIEINNIWRNYASAWILPEKILPFANTYKSSYAILNTNNIDVINEGPGVMKSDDFIANGAQGQGIKVAVIDLQFMKHDSCQNAGVIPQNLQTPLGDPENGGPHGTACIEMVFDHAPQATQYAYLSGGANADLGTIIEDCIDRDMDIISYSVGSFNTGWFDDEGTSCALFNQAANSGILCFVAAGNYADMEHYQSNWSDPDADNWFNFTGTDEENEMRIDSGETITLSLQWKAGPDPISDDYDLFLYNDANDSLLASSTNCCQFETLEWDNNLSQFDGDSITAYFKIKNDGTDENDLELFSRSNGKLQYFTEDNSTTSPSNSTAPNVVSVGAVIWNNYVIDSLGAVNINAPYSSQGPSNGGMALPDICAPTHTTSFIYNGSFTGTSCATPNAAGMAAAFWSANPNLNADGVRKLLFKMADMFGDFGAPNHDMIYGRGGFFLHDYIPNTRYILANSGNSTGTSALPYNSIEQADQYDSGNRNMLFLGQSFQEPPSGIIIDKPMLYQSMKFTTTIQ